MKLFQVDAFTDRLFAGNPAGVCLLEAEVPDAWMQSMAAEMNLSETAFLLGTPSGWSLRWFTPRVEVALCGHATLSTAHIMLQEGMLQQGHEAVFHTKSGPLSARAEDEWIVLDFPAKKVVPVAPPPGLIEALGLERDEYLFCGKNKDDYLLELPDEELVRSLDPDFVVLSDVEARGTMVTAPSSRCEFDFASRFFAPAVGVNEDPVTGSAHCALAPYWGKKLGKTLMNAEQVSARGGVMLVEVQGERVLLRGKAVTVFRGEMTVS
ncbi:MAG TPA: PhzF family phenazine biosynthesis protein [Synergistales bacterium]|nr:PhzF family phenazine biosynthesis protein [Synergistales bacterium]